AFPRKALPAALRGGTRARARVEVAARSTARAPPAAARVRCGLRPRRQDAPPVTVLRVRGPAPGRKPLPASARQSSCPTPPPTAPAAGGRARGGGAARPPPAAGRGRAAVRGRPPPPPPAAPPADAASRTARAIISRKSGLPPARSTSRLRSSGDTSAGRTAAR